MCPNTIIILSTPKDLTHFKVNSTNTSDVSHKVILETFILKCSKLSRIFMCIRRVWMCLQRNVDTHYCRQRDII